MKERVTFVHPLEAPVDPQQLQVEATSLQGPSSPLVQETRLTINLAELPSELSGLLQRVKELHLRWASPESNHNRLEPFISRLSPGLHLSFTPSTADTSERICSSLQQFFGPLDCSSPESFTDLREGRSSSSPSLYFYQELEHLDAFIGKVTKHACLGQDASCQDRLRDLRSASGLDISFDSATKLVRVAALWPLRDVDLSVSASSMQRTEIGIFGIDSPMNIQPHEVGVSGTLTVLGEHKEPSPAVFAFPARHREAQTSFSSKFLSPTGLHPALQLKLSTNLPPVQDAECAPFAYLTLPKAIFADRYQLADELFLASKNLTATRYVSQPVDLEAPAYTTKAWGSSVLLELAPPNVDAKEVAWTAEVPLHLRYLKPSPTGEVNIEVPYPVVFWACESGEGIDFGESPFDRKSLGYDDLFSSTTAFWHVKPNPEMGSRLTNSVTIPALKDGKASLIETGTAAAVALGFAWVLWKLFSAAKPSQGGASTATKQVKTGAKKRS